MNPYEAQRAILERLQKLESRVALMETVDHVSVGEAAGQSAYYRPTDGSLHTPIGVNLTGGGGIPAVEFRRSVSTQDDLYGALAFIQTVSGTQYVAQIDARRGSSANYGYLVFKTRNGISTAERMRIAEDGKVIIAGEITIGTNILVSGSIRKDVSTSGLTLFGGNGDGGNIELYGPSAGTPSNRIYYDGNQHTFRDVNAGTTAKVGINNSSPANTLDVLGTIAAQAAGGQRTKLDGNGVGFDRASANYIWADTAGGYLAFGTNGLARGLANTSLYLDTNGHVRVHTNFLGVGASTPQFPVDVNLSNANWAARFYNSDTAADPRGVIIRGGASSNNTSYYLYFQKAGGTHVGNVRGDNGAGVNYNSASDERNKQDIEPLAGSLARVLALRPISYRGRGAPVATPKVPGFSAQEVMAALPAAAYYDGDTDTYGVAWNKMIPDIVGAIQTLDGRLAALEAA